MIIDCHGHFTTAPAAHTRFREQQLAWFADPTLPPPTAAVISDDELRATLEKNQLELQRKRGSDLTLFSPRASAMGHHLGDQAVSLAWSRACNDLIARVVDLYPETEFAPRALLGLFRANEAIGYSDLASEARDQLLQDYPNSPEAEELNTAGDAS